MRCFQVPTPDVGRSLSWTEKMRMRTMARKNWGVTMPRTAPMVAAVSIMVPRRRAAMMPRGRPRAMPRMRAAAPRRRLLGRRSKMTVVVGTP